MKYTLLILAVLGVWITSTVQAVILYDLSGTVLDGNTGENTYFVSNGQTASLTYNSGTPSITWEQGSASNYTYMAGYFSSQSLSVGDSIQLAYTIVPGSNTAFHASDQALRLGLFHSGGTRITDNSLTTGSTAFNTDTGYMGTYRPNGSPGTGNTILQRGGSNALLFAGGAFTQVSSAPTMGSPGTGTITGTLTLTLISAGSLQIDSQINGGSVQSVIDSSGLVTSFDMFGLFSNSGDSDSADALLTLTDLSVTYNAVPEPSTYGLLACGVLTLLFLRRCLPTFVRGKEDARI